MHLAAQEDRVPVAQVLVKHKSQIDAQTKVIPPASFKQFVAFEKILQKPSNS